MNIGDFLTGAKYKHPTIHDYSSRANFNEIRETNDMVKDLYPGLLKNYDVVSEGGIGRHSTFFLADKNKKLYQTTVATYPSDTGNLVPNLKDSMLYNGVKSPAELVQPVINDSGKHMQLDEFFGLSDNNTEKLACDVAAAVLYKLAVASATPDPTKTYEKLHSKAQTPPKIVRYTKPGNIPQNTDLKSPTEI